MSDIIVVMIAYHNDPTIKEKYITRVRTHREADQLVQGYGYWEDGKGCAVGCTLHSSNHAAYETELGIPRVIARLEDGIFEGLPVDLARLWPERFLAAIKPGADLSLISAKWFAWMLVDETDGVLRFAKTDRSREAIIRVADLYKRQADGEDVSISDFKSAVAYAVADAYTAYAYAAVAAAAAAADAVAAYAAAAAAYAAAAAAYADAAAYAADAADDAYAAYAAAAYAAAARSQARVRQADKLIELLEAA